MCLRNYCFVIILKIICDNIYMTGGACTAGPGDVKTFGPDCQYQCHCKNGAACDEDTGYCQNNCDVKWYGPGCQLSDLAETEMARHLDNVLLNIWAHYANDGDKATCSYTNIATAGLSRTRPPWWRVQTPKLETIWEMTFLTKEEYLHYFKGFKVTVETAPADRAGDGKYYPPETEVKLCYQHDNSVPSNESIHVTCGTPLTGNVVRIELASKFSQLVLCDVRIYGGRNLAFKKNVTFSAAMDEDLYPATLVVDGDSRNSSLDYCFSTIQSTSDYWVTVDLGHLAFINRIKISEYNDDRIRDYEIYISNTTEQMDAVLAYSDNSKYPPNLEVSMHAIGQFVKLERPKNRDATVICELEIYGECSAGKCGFNCLTECHCKTFEERVTGVCTSGCEARWTGPGLECINNCDETHWGEQCTLQCGRCKDFQPCDVVTGYCKSGCQNGTLDTPLCDTDCPNGTYGENCTLECSGNCLDGDACRKTDGHCERGCSPGFTDDKCDTKCMSGSYGFNCSSTCSVNCASVYPDCDHINGSCLDGCLPGWEGSRCEKECDVGFWGKNCVEVCGHCLSGTCNARNGECSGGCEAGYKDTPKCDQECGIYRYGDNCNRFCSPKCKDVCDRVNGTCSNCTFGWKGSKCLQECDSGEWGENCENQCGHCLNGSCDPSDGTCVGGCSPGYKTTDRCIEKCPAGSYGADCLNVCSSNCKIIGACNHTNGYCDTCKPGKQGFSCDKDCDNRTYGENCLQSCGACVNNESCDPISGHCKRGCSIGYKHSLLCQHECEDGYHGYNCSGVCGNCKPGTTCDKITGVCNEGCSEKYMGSICVEAMIQKSKATDSFPVAGVVGGLFAAVVVIAILVLVCLMWRRKKRKMLMDMPNSDVRLDSSPFDDLKGERDGDKQNNVYANQVDKKDNVYENSIDKQKNVYENSANIQAELALSKASRNYNSKGTISVPAEEQMDDVYCNEGPVGTKWSETSILVEELKNYVDKITRNDNNLEKDFKKLPVGLQHPTTVATNPGNAGKNRYKAMYAYDHCRVILKSLPDNPYSNYINAAFIRGHFKENAYIAAQGPIDFTLDDFWRMIWEKDIQTVVMATNLVELTKMKCIRYWSDADERLMYGSVIVQTGSEDIFAEFTIRTLIVSHEDNPGTVRTVTQFHYTAWPDKDVPRSTTSLLHFWYRVRKHDKEKERPWLVHCSAGVGRTGTFTALDILYDQGMDQGYVDIFGCVRDLRDQRICMVQTKEQYMYLHKCLVEALVLPSQPVHIDNFPSVYRELIEIDPNTGKTKLLLQYESLLDETDSGSGSRSDEFEHKYSSAKDAVNRNKNRYSNILASNDCRPFLCTKVQGCSDYINAVWIPSYRDPYGYILTQTPLENTAVDCCRLILEQEVYAIIAFEESLDDTIGQYLPNSGSLDVEPFTITLISEEKNDGHYMSNTYKMKYDSKEHVFLMLLYKQWPPSRAVPDDPYNMMAFLQDIECVQRQAENKPILLQCLNGAERSGLLVVLLNVMERITCTGEVSIPQVLRQLQIRRQQIIPNFEQFKFCHSVLKTYAESNATYANM